MDSLASVSPSMLLPSTSNSLHLWRRFTSFFSIHKHCLLPRLVSLLPASYFSVPSSRRRSRRVSCKFSNHGSKYPEEQADEDGGREDVERALHLDCPIPGISNEFVKQVSSRAYDMRRNLQQSFDSSSYDVNILEANPWREATKPLYVLTQRKPVVQN